MTVGLTPSISQLPQDEFGGEMGNSVLWDSCLSDRGMVTYQKEKCNTLCISLGFLLSLYLYSIRCVSCEFIK